MTKGHGVSGKLTNPMRMTTAHIVHIAIPQASDKIPEIFTSKITAHDEKEFASAAKMAELAKNELLLAAPLEASH